MAVTNQELFNIFLENPNMSDSQIVTLMETRGISPEQVSSTFGIPVGEVAARVAEVIPPNQAVLLGDTYVQAINEVRGSGEDQQVGGLENVITYKASENKVGGNINYYSPTGEYQQTTKQQEVNATQDFLKFLAGSAVLFGGIGGGFDGLFSGPAAGNGAFLGEGVASGIPSFDAAFLNAGGTFNPAFGLPVGNGAFLGEGVPTGIPASDAAFLNAGGTFNPAFTLAPDGLLGTPIVVPPTGVPPTGVPTTGVPPTGVPPTGVPPTGVPPTGVPPVVTPPTGIPPIVTPPTGIPIPTVADITRLAQTGLTAAQIAALFSSTATTASGLLQQQTSREAAQKAQAMIDAETAAAKASAQFRPVGMTTRFGSSQFAVDPVTGRLTSAGYTLSPEAKAAQDRFVKLAETGIQQAEGAQKAFEPLQTGAQSLFKLGQGYLAEKPEDVAKNYLASQMALLQPGRETELANLQNRLQQQGRGGLAVAQGGTMGATTPELQALYNARAQQEAQLAANAQQYGQQQVQFGAGLLGTGAQTLGQYYAGQQGAYAPYTTAMGQITGLEALGQQPFSMSTGLAQQTAQAGANVGQLGLRGAEQSVALATGRAATTNPYATLLGGVGASDAFGQVVGGMFSGVPATTAMSAPATTFGTGNYYGRQDLGLFL
jgi:hypothetical protein